MHYFVRSAALALTLVLGLCLPSSASPRSGARGASWVGLPDTARCRQTTSRSSDEVLRPIRTVLEPWLPAQAVDVVVGESLCIGSAYRYLPEPASDGSSTSRALEPLYLVSDGHPFVVVLRAQLTRLQNGEVLLT